MASAAYSRRFNPFGNMAFTCSASRWANAKSTGLARRPAAQSDIARIAPFLAVDDSCGSTGQNFIVDALLSLSWTRIDVRKHAIVLTCGALKDSDANVAWHPGETKMTPRSATRHGKLRKSVDYDS